MCGRPSTALLCFCCCLCVSRKIVNSLLIYDRETQSEYLWSADLLVLFDHERQDSLPLLRKGIPAYLYGAPAPTGLRKHRRRTGNRTGPLVKLKACLAHSPRDFLAQCGSLSRLPVLRCSQDPADSWLVPVVGLDQVIQTLHTCPPHLRWRGANLAHLRSLAPAPPLSAATDLAPIRMGLVNARSVTNKTFNRKDFFAFRSLDFLCITET